MGHVHQGMKSLTQSALILLLQSPKISHGSTVGALDERSMRNTRSVGDIVGCRLVNVGIDLNTLDIPSNEDRLQEWNLPLLSLL